ncbi:uncharacterized protein LOC143041586 [Oratosquilla oratoria]|uniref:uncharacterized protein LOC143041586 n=1 Tax=Oratosquilla oratoria TaxID=337810 RepID=UPI003F778317
MAKHKACLSGMLKELETAKQLMEALVKKYGKLPQVSITLKAAENLTTREHKGVYHLPTSSSQVGAIVNLGPSRDPLEIVIGSPKEDSKFSLRLMSHTNFFYDVFQYPLLFPNGDVGHSCMLSFIEHNQQELRKERADILIGDGDNRKAGQRVIIPASFVGGPRYMKARQQDALAFVSSYGSPDFFITFTMNPHWEELKQAVEAVGCDTSRMYDRPDFVSRIFKLKVDSLMDDLTIKNVFGRVKAHLLSVEWQKRGLPHVHILLWMERHVTAELVSRVISAEIPDKNKEPRLYEIVATNMIHGPCRGFDESQLCCQGKYGSKSLCIVWKGFSENVRGDMYFGNNGYPLYRRRAVGEGGHSFEKKVKGEKIKVDNSWVVPYSPCLCLKYNAHINVECSNYIKCIAHVTKYVNKGCDRILFSKTKEGEDVNEVRKFQEARFVNANEASWKIFKFAIHRSHPPVATLDLHLGGENAVFFKENASKEEIDRKTSKDTHLTPFFKLCERKEFAAGLYYNQLPIHFVFNNTSSVWEERKTTASSLGRIRAVTNKTVELFYLRLLLTHVKGPTSYEDLRTFEGVIYPSYREAVKAMGLLNDEETWKKTILEIINHTNDRNQLRATYASMLVFSELEDQSGIWEEAKDLFTSEFLQRQKATEYNDEIYLDALDDIQEHVWNCGGGSITQYGLPLSRCGEKTSNIIRREKAYNKEKLTEEVKEKSLLLNSKQRLCYDTVLFCIENATMGYSWMLQEKIALVVASSDIASTVLHGGRTAHNMFKIPLLDYNEVCACSIKKNSELAKLLSMTSLIVWDEVVMANKNTLAALDVSLRDILGVPGRFMGGIVFVCAGDFRQILPVKRGRNDYFWDDLLKLELTRNVRLKADDAENKIFAKNLLALGRGESGPVILPEKFGIVVETRKELVDKVYDNFEENHLNAAYFEKRAIISPTNDDVDRINLMVYDKSEEPEKVYMSGDTAMEEVTDIQTSFFNAITSLSLPLHMLRLKVGSVIMIMRNICPPKLCNGSRVIVTNLQKNIIVGKILGGTHRGEQVLLPRITLESTDTTIPFKRKQFPVKLSYAMTINKFQGQTFDRCGILLDSAQCFAHEQLYVACSRITSWNSLIIYTGWEKVNDDFRMKLPRNCVYKELFVESLSEEDKPPEAVVVSDDQEAALAEEEPDQSIVEIPKEVYTISEEEAIKYYFLPNILKTVTTYTSIYIRATEYIPLKASSIFTKFRLAPQSKASSTFKKFRRQVVGDLDIDGTRYIWRGSENQTEVLFAPSTLNFWRKTVSEHLTKEYRTQKICKHLSCVPYNHQ